MTEEEERREEIAYIIERLKFVDRLKEYFARNELRLKKIRDQNTKKILH